MNEYETIYLDNMLLPDYAELIEIPQPNATRNETLDGSLYVDFMNNRRKWQISWNLLSSAEYQNIRAKYDKQFSEQRMLTLSIPAINVYTNVYISINEKRIKYNGQYVKDCTIILEEQSPVS